MDYTLPIDAIHRTRCSRERVFQPERLEELAASIRANGIIQPLIVRRVGETYQIVAGERRWRAAKLAGLTEVPVVVQDVADPHMLELALIENIQREDLNPIETAHAYDRLSRELGLSHEEIGRRTGKDRTSITNMVRLLEAPQGGPAPGRRAALSMGHAGPFSGLTARKTQIQMAEKAAAQGLRCARWRRWFRKLTCGPIQARRASAKEAPQDPNVKAAVEELERALGTRVRIVELSEQRGRIEIEYYSQAELDRLFQHIVGSELKIGAGGRIRTCDLRIMRPSL